MESVDVHQHLLGEPLIAALSRRRGAPNLTRSRDGWTFHVAGEPDSHLSAEAVDADLRAEEMAQGRIDQALVALSSALGIESLPADEAAPLIEAHHEGVAALPDRFGGWGAVGLAEPDPSAVDAALDRGCVGISLPAAALADPAGLDRVGPLLERLERRGAPLFVHPGPVVSRAADEAAALPAWWPALTDYVAQMQAAWFAFLDAGRAAHPRLRVLFAMLAGGAPLQRERYAARAGAAIPLPDPLVFYDTSSYGPRMLSAMVGAVGAEQLVYGSDRPVVEAETEWRPGAFLGRDLSSTNTRRLLAPETQSTSPKGVPA
jgi:predicted TIM-barrel fold metal-dependent hydrolase